MAPTQSTPGKAPRRQSCDRCHGQKLRCSRAGDSETGACSRCLRQGAQCVYSSSLPKGRPSIYSYRVAETDEKSSTQSNFRLTPPISPEQRRRNLVGTQNKSSDTITPASKSNGNGNSSTNNSNTNSNSSNNAPSNINPNSTPKNTNSKSTDPNPNPNSNSNSNNSISSINTHVITNPNTDTMLTGGHALMDIDMDMDLDIDTTSSTSAMAWPWLAPLDWSDTQISEQDTTNTNANLHVGNVNPIDTLTLHPDACGEFLDAFPSLLGWDIHHDAGASSPGAGRLDVVHNGIGNGSGGGGDIFETSNSNSMKKNVNTSTSNSTNTNNLSNPAPDAAIALLSRLSTQLYPLHRSSSLLASTSTSSFQSTGRHCPLIDDSAFKCVAAWLVHVSANMNTLFHVDREGGKGDLGGGVGLGGLDEMGSTGNTLHDTLAASHQLLEVLCCLHVDGSGGTSSPSPLSSSTSNSNSSSTSISSSNSTNTNSEIWPNLSSNPIDTLHSSVSTDSAFEAGNGNGSYGSGRPNRQYSSTVVRHLVIACHTMLLEIFVTVLTALQQDADFRSTTTSSSSSNSNSSSSNNTNFNTNSTSNFNLPNSAGDCTTAAPLADMRLVMVVQVCSYLIERQFQAVDLYLAQDDGIDGEKVKKNGKREARSVQEMELQQRLGRLRETLRM